MLFSVNFLLRIGQLELKGYHQRTGYKNKTLVNNLEKNRMQEKLLHKRLN
jgi:hypothetical protein